MICWRKFKPWAFRLKFQEIYGENKISWQDLTLFPPLPPGVLKSRSVKLNCSILVIKLRGNNLESCLTTRTRSVPLFVFRKLGTRVVNIVLLCLFVDLYHPFLQASDWSRSWQVGICLSWRLASTRHGLKCGQNMTPHTCGNNGGSWDPSSSQTKSCLTENLW